MNSSFTRFMMVSIASVTFPSGVYGFHFANRRSSHRESSFKRQALSDKYLENDLVAVKLPDSETPRLCAVKPWGIVDPLCQHEDDVETDLFVDPRKPIKFYEDLTDDAITGIYGEGFYGQRPVPSLGGGPGYGAPADEIWSVDEEILEQVRADGVEIPMLDVGPTHGEKARGGAF